MSFLEMLDVVNEELIAQGRGADRLRPRLPRGHLRHVRLVINGSPHGPRRGDDDLPAAHAPLQGRRRRSSIEPWRATAFPVVKDLVVDRTRVRPHHPGRRLRLRRRPAARRTATRSSIPKDGRRPRDGRRRLHRLRRLRRRLPERARRCSSSRAKVVAPRRSCRRASPSATTACSTMVAQMDAEGFGNCTNHGECEARLPEGDPARVHRAAEPRLPQGEPHGAPEAGGGRLRLTI